MSKIYGFLNSINGGRAIAYAIAEDGTCLVQGECFSENDARHALGFVENFMPNLHENAYAKHYPEGYELEWVMCAGIQTHEGLQKAYKTNQSRKAALPNIYCFAPPWPTWAGVAYAIAEDGECLATASGIASEAEARRALCPDVSQNLTISAEPQPHDDVFARYHKKYPKGYTLVWVPCADIQTHEGLNSAYRLNVQPNKSRDPILAAA